MTEDNCFSNASQIFYPCSLLSRKEISHIHLPKIKTQAFSSHFKDTGLQQIFPQPQPKYLRYTDDKNMRYALFMYKTFR